MFPEVTMPSNEIYSYMGENQIYALIHDFYQELHNSPIKEMFRDDPRVAAQRSAWFFIQIFGGPPLYQQKRGEPRMRSRHLPFQITEAHRQMWINCFFKILENATTKYNFPEEHLPQFKNYLENFSHWMVADQDSTAK